MQTARQQLLDRFHVKIFVHGGDLLQCRGHNTQITTQLADQGRYLFGVTQHLNRLRVRIVPHSERSLDVLGEGSGKNIGFVGNLKRISCPRLPHLFLGLFEGIRIVVGILISRNDALLAAGHLRVEPFDLIRGGDGVIEFGHRGKQSGSEHLERSILLTAQPKLDREEV